MCAAPQAATSLSPARQGWTAAGARRSADSSRRVLSHSGHSTLLSGSRSRTWRLRLRPASEYRNRPSPCTHCDASPPYPALFNSQRGVPSQELLAVLCSELGDGAVPFVRPIEVRQDVYLFGTHRAPARVPCSQAGSVACSLRRGTARRGTAGPADHSEAVVLRRVAQGRQATHGPLLQVKAHLPVYGIALGARARQLRAGR